MFFAQQRVRELSSYLAQFSNPPAAMISRCRWDSSQMARTVLPPISTASVSAPGSSLC
jgi:hypothetical protein